MSAPSLETANAVTLTGYLEKVSEFWEQANTVVCQQCDFYDGPGYCAMLHDRSVPNGDCLGLLERDGVKQPLCSVDGI